MFIQIIMNFIVQTPTKRVFCENLNIASSPRFGYEEFGVC